MDLRDATLMFLAESAAYPAVAELAQSAYDRLAEGEDIDYRVLDASLSCRYAAGAPDRRGTGGWTSANMASGSRGQPAANARRIPGSGRSSASAFSDRTGLVHARAPLRAVLRSRPPRRPAVTCTARAVQTAGRGRAPSASPFQ